MRTPALQSKDVLAGLLFLFVGGIAFYTALDYSFGTVARMGPGFFPRVLAVVLMLFGLVTLARGLVSRDPVHGRWGWAPLALLVVAITAFGYLMERAGMIPALVVLFVTSAWAGHEFRMREVVVLTAVMCLMATAVFVWGLGLPYRLFVVPG
ncbi:MAG: tripartite tricarboxylate transporter TctB family protein [Ectothiorhodospiraceae bacterium]|nr:tripartite tricarboxylate transporter TctB family protein [Chromatiales bacterium]MCP5156368.1 tripartite tricarboxylate transporter TctB family protein [Ectothiorhodospiraceae bacterium]